MQFAFTENVFNDALNLWELDEKYREGLTAVAAMWRKEPKPNPQDIRMFSFAKAGELGPTTVLFITRDGGRECLFIPLEGDAFWKFFEMQDITVQEAIEKYGNKEDGGLMIVGIEEEEIYG